MARGVALVPLLALALALAAGDGPVAGTARPEGQSDDSTAASHGSAAGDSPESAPAGQLDLIVSHQMERGRFIVRLAGAAFLSIPFAAAGDGIARFERPLSVPSGTHPVEISFLDRQGRVVVQKRTEGTVPVDRSVVLHVDERSRSGEGLSLTWRTP
jgi:hypothetical protein